MLPIARAQAPSQRSEAERFGRVRVDRAPDYLEFSRTRANPPSYDSASYYAQLLIHRAHVVMLAEQDTLTKEEAATILGGLAEVKEMDADANAITRDDGEPSTTPDDAGPSEVDSAANDEGPAVRPLSATPLRLRR